jgi:amidase
MSTFIEPSSIGTAGLRVAVKDLIDVAGLPTTGGCRALALDARPAAVDAPCMRGVRAAVDSGEARIVGKTNLDELGGGCVGINPWFGRVPNPLDPDLVCGGSSSGSAAAVADDEADIGIGTDTGGSVRIPAACCGLSALKTTHGRISTEGVIAFSQTLDTVGPIARDIAGVEAGMRLLEPGFAAAADPARVVGRVRVPGVDPTIEAAVDGALAAAELEVVEVELPGWASAYEAALSISVTEALRNHGAMIEREPENVGPATTAMILKGVEYAAAEVDGRRLQWAWLAQLERAFERVELLATPTLAGFPVSAEEPDATFAILRTMELNLAGVPALAQPIRTEAPIPASLQLFGPRRSEELIVATGHLVERAAGGVAKARA